MQKWVNYILKELQKSSLKNEKKTDEKSPQSWTKKASFEPELEKHKW